MGDFLSGDGNACERNKPAENSGRHLSIPHQSVVFFVESQFGVIRASTGVNGTRTVLLHIMIEQIVRPTRIWPVIVPPRDGFGAVAGTILKGRRGHGSSAQCHGQNHLPFLIMADAVKGKTR
jgi:hypothetical protein